MKKLLLSSSVMFFLCSVGFAQANKTALPLKADRMEAAKKTQKELDEKKVKDYQSSQAKGSQKSESAILADKQRVEAINAERNAQKAATSFVDPRSN
ncbi:MAG: hypothetical protein LH615_02080 [Ferruginibacter sp.]|nr:hypothetical protein [Ferruginibacter sp.]